MAAPRKYPTIEEFNALVQRLTALESWAGAMDRSPVGDILMATQPPAALAKTPQLEIGPNPSDPPDVQAYYAAQLAATKAGKPGYDGIADWKRKTGWRDSDRAA